ncbi:aspartyl protease family protein [Novosphingobium sp. BL-8A]|uniref:aspartyl protease family protein n=1 Tax=Novosphingobium sp. BL-8A TaxID=3127639 RepID=UPI0037564B45
MNAFPRFCIFVATAMLAALSQPALAAGAKCKVELVAKFPVVMEGQRASVPVSFNGKDSRVWLDSGAFFNFMSKAKAVELGLTTEALPSGYRVNGIGGGFTPELARVRDFGILGINLHNLEFIVGGSDSGNGFLGANLLGVWDTEFDLAKGAVNIFKENGCSQMSMAYWGTGMAVGEARLFDGSYPGDHAIYVEVFVNGHSVRAVLDTGAPASIIGRHAAESAGIDLDAPQVVASRRMSGVGSHERQSWIARTTSISIGGENIANSPIRVIDDAGDSRNYDMLLGMDFLMAHHVIISRPQHRMYLTYNGGPIFSASTDGETGHRSTTRGENLGATENAADPKTADEFAGRASARLTKGDAAGAVADFTSAIGLAPERADLLAHRAQAYGRSGKFELAAKDVDAALAIAPHDHRLLIRRALIKLGKGDRAGALADTEAAAADTPKGSLDVIAVVTMYERLGMADRGLALIDPVIDLHRSDVSYPHLLNARSWNRGLANADLDRALKDINVAIRKSGAGPAMLDTRALIQFRLKDYASAIADESAALEKSPKMAAALFVRGLARIASGDAAGGDTDVVAARKIRPSIDRDYAAYGLHAAGATNSPVLDKRSFEPDEADDQGS